MKTRFWSLPVLILAALALTACGGTPKKEGGAEVSNGGAATTTTGGAGAQTSGAAGASGIYAEQLNDPNSALFNKVVYFDFDKSNIRPEFVDTLRAHAAFLANNPEVKVTVEGHCDERGSREYNIGLGERRAASVLSFFSAEGVASSQVNTISYGEERPAAMGHDESAWSQNRRAVIVYEY